MVPVEDLPLPLFTVGRQGLIQSANRNALGLLGVEWRILAGMPISVFLHTDSTAKFMSHLWTAFQRPGESFGVSVVMRGGDRQHFSVAIHSLVPKEDESGESSVCRIMVVPEQPFLEAIPPGRHLFDRISLGLAQIDPDDRLLSCNPYLCSFLDYHADQLIGCELSRIVLEWNPQAVAQRSRQGHPSRAIAVRRDGIRLSAEIQLISLPQDPRKSPGRLLVIRDLRQQEALERRSLRLAELERQAIGRELHDALGQNMVALALMADELAVVPPAENGELAQRIAELCRETTRMSRALVKGLAPVGLGGGDLPTALRDLCRSCSLTFPVHCDALCQSIPMDEEVAEQLFRIAQEAVTNAIKHSGCQSIEVNLRLHQGDLVLTVRDDGRGIGSEAQQEFGTGLHSMHHRAQLLGAALNIEPDRKRATKAGCRVTVRLPLSRTRVDVLVPREETDHSSSHIAWH